MLYELGRGAWLALANEELAALARNQQRATERGRREDVKYWQEERGKLSRSITDVLAAGWDAASLQVAANG